MKIYKSPLFCLVFRSTFFIGLKAYLRDLNRLLYFVRIVSNFERILQVKLQLLNPKALIRQDIIKDLIL